MQTSTTSPGAVLAEEKARYASYGSQSYRFYVLFLLFLVYALTALDRTILQVLVEPIKNELGLSDSQIGIIVGPAFSIAFTIVGIPLGILADRHSRKNIIASCLMLWSLMTAYCGAVSGYFQMILGRMGVGIGEAGGAPGSMAIISDIFPPSRRATALSIFYMGGAFGAVLAFGVGAWIATQYGWRVAFFAAAIPGVIVALAIFLTLREPPRGLADGKKNTDALPIGTSLRFILGQRSVVHMIVGLIFLHAVGNGLFAFLASYSIRSHGMTLAEAGAMISMLYLVASPISQLLAGLLADFLGRFDIRWRIRLGSLGSVLAGLAITAMMFAGSKIGVAIAFICWAFSSGVYQSPIYALLQTMVKPRMRATIGSVQFVMTSAIGGALGPLFVGVTSDLLASRFGIESLRYALLALGLFYFWAAVHFVLSERHLKGDLARAEAD